MSDPPQLNIRRTKRPSSDVRSKLPGNEASEYPTILKESKVSLGNSKGHESSRVRIMVLLSYFTHFAVSLPYIDSVTWSN